MSQHTIIWASVAPIVAVNLYLFWRYLKASDRFRAAMAKRQRLYMLHNAIPVFSGTVRHNGKSYQITNFAKTCYVIQSPEPPVSLQKTNGVLDVDKGRVDSTLVLIRLDIEAQPIDTILSFIKKNY